MVAGDVTLNVWIPEGNTEGPKTLKTRPRDREPLMPTEPSAPTAKDSKTVRG